MKYKPKEEIESIFKGNEELILTDKKDFMGQTMLKFANFPCWHNENDFIKLGEQ